MEANKLKKVVEEIKAFCIDIESAPCCSETKADCGGPDYSDVLCSLQCVREELNWLSRRLSEHVDNGHLPPIPSTEKLEKILSILTLDQEYKVEKKTIYASDGKRSSQEVRIVSKD